MESGTVTIEERDSQSEQLQLTCSFMMAKPHIQPGQVYREQVSFHTISCPQAPIRENQTRKARRHVLTALFDALSLNRLASDDRRRVAASHQLVSVVTLQPSLAHHDGILLYPPEI